MKPLYLLTVDELPLDAIGLVVRQAEDGHFTGQILLPAWEEIPAGFDGPHSIEIAVLLADSYADAYGYRAILIDIESSQL